jgi:hypothetical protein
MPVLDEAELAASAIKTLADFAVRIHRHRAAEGPGTDS